MYTVASSTRPRFLCNCRSLKTLYNRRVVQIVDAINVSECEKELGGTEYAITQASTCIDLVIQTAHQGNIKGFDV